MLWEPRFAFNSQNRTTLCTCSGALSPSLLGVCVLCSRGRQNAQTGEQIGVPRLSRVGVVVAFFLANFPSRPRLGKNLSRPPRRGNWKVGKVGINMREGEGGDLRGRSLPPSLGAVHAADIMINLSGAYEYANRGGFCFQGREAVLERGCHRPCTFEASKRRPRIYGCSRSCAVLLKKRKKERCNWIVGKPGPVLLSPRWKGACIGMVSCGSHKAVEGA